jgi:hypothetical protein
MPHFSTLVIFALSSSLKSSLTASSEVMFMINRPITDSAGVFWTGEDAVSAPFVVVPLVAAAPLFSFSLFTGPGRLTTLVAAGCGVAGFWNGAGESLVRAGTTGPLCCCC